MKTMKIAKLILGLLIITTSILSAQDCVKRTNRFSENPQVVTVYSCSSLLIKNEVKKSEYNISILVDSVQSEKKIYRLFADFSIPVEYPQFDVELVSGEVLTIYADFETPNYMEAWLTDAQLTMFRNRQVRTITIWHTYLDKPNPPVRCDTFFSDFLARY